MYGDERLRFDSDILELLGGTLTMISLNCWGNCVPFKDGCVEFDSSDLNNQVMISLQVTASLNR